MASSTPITIRLNLGTSISYTLSSTSDDNNTITPSTTLLQVKQRIASIEDLADSYPVERQRLYLCVGNDRIYLQNDDRTLLSHGISGGEITFYLGRANQRRRLNNEANTPTVAPSSNERQRERQPSVPERTTALISYRRADELFENLQQRMTQLRQMQNAQMIRRSQRQHLDDMINELLENCSEISDVLAMSSDICSEHVLDALYHFASIKNVDAESCAICKVDFARCNLKRKPVVKTSCNHAFHRECLKKWMVASDNLTCPLCRSRV